MNSVERRVGAGPLLAHHDVAELLGLPLSQTVKSVVLMAVVTRLTGGIVEAAVGGIVLLCGLAIVSFGPGTWTRARTIASRSLTCATPFSPRTRRTLREKGQSGNWNSCHMAPALAPPRHQSMASAR